MRLAVIISVILGAALIVGVFWSVQVMKLNSEAQTRQQKIQQELLEANYQLGNLYRAATKENVRLAGTVKQREEKLAIQERLAGEQRRLIGAQQELSTVQVSKIGGLETELGGAKVTIEELKKQGGAPLPKNFIDSLLQATVRIRCFLSQEGNVRNYRAGSGSLLGRYNAVDYNYVVMTNAHVTRPNVATGAPDCDVVFGEGEAVYRAPVVRKVEQAGLDFAFLKLDQPKEGFASTTLVSYEELGVGFCEFKDVAIGDRITVLSFPKFTGPENAVSVGEITDILDGPIYEASAIIDQGSSGGVAILNKKKCALGMPTWEGIGARLGISYIQSWPMMLGYNH